MSADWLGLEGRTAIVTGAGGGIGRATSVALAQAGCKVGLIDRDARNLQETLADIQATGGWAEALACDVADPASIESAAARGLASLGPCDILVNNAGLLRPGPLETLSFAEWNSLLAVNLTGYFLCAQMFGRQMHGRGGALVHVASIAARHATGFGGAYSVAKAGVVMLSRQLATEWSAHKIRSNCVSPGMIQTPLSQSFYEQPGATERRSALIPSARIGQPQDIADAILFLASPRSHYVNGEEIVVDGAFTRNIMSFIPRAGYAAPSAQGRDA
jgi:NAD(P)-dependent dehydrogenase (short-subunit alcohol dehydrogenase family)